MAALAQTDAQKSFLEGLTQEGLAFFNSVAEKPFSEQAT